MDFPEETRRSGDRGFSCKDGLSGLFLVRYRWMVRKKAKFSWRPGVLMMNSIRNYNLEANGARGVI